MQNSDQFANYLIKMYFIPRYAGFFSSSPRLKFFKFCVTFLVLTSLSFSICPKRIMSHTFRHCHQTCSGMCITDPSVNIPEAIRAKQKQTVIPIFFQLEDLNNTKTFTHRTSSQGAQILIIFGSSLNNPLNNTAQARQCNHGVYPHTANSFCTCLYHAVQHFITCWLVIQLLHVCVFSFKIHSEMLKKRGSGLNTSVFHTGLSMVQCTQQRSLYFDYMFFQKFLG